jgi:hypothetical protein
MVPAAQYRTEKYLIPGIDYCPHCFDSISDKEMKHKHCNNCGHDWDEYEYFIDAAPGEDYNEYDNILILAKL